MQQVIALIMLFLTLGQSTLVNYTAQMNLGGALMLVNRDYTLSSSYTPADLVMPNVERASDAVLLRSEAARALEDMCAAAQQEAGLTLVALSGYRSYSKQAAIHSKKVEKAGKKAANRVSAPAGASEHQLGLAMDLCTTYDHGLEERFASTPEGQWVGENCWRFGFIIRYKTEWEDVTGYMNEPWHIRYVGREHAKIIYEMNIPLEYYIAALKDESLQAILNTP
ncbi:MAG: D-alanyl-D-alanine carboxypeptidase [Clostridiales bacterium]|nr:D-alanyl-D-alanine carboxypeptidase [Clostridiales bacterium]